MSDEAAVADMAARFRALVEVWEEQREADAAAPALRISPAGEMADEA